MRSKAIQLRGGGSPSTTPMALGTAHALADPQGESDHPRHELHSNDFAVLAKTRSCPLFASADCHCEAGDHLRVSSPTFLARCSRSASSRSSTDSDGRSSCSSRNGSRMQTCTSSIGRTSTSPPGASSRCRARRWQATLDPACRDVLEPHHRRARVHALGLRQHRHTGCNARRSDPARDRRAASARAFSPSETVPSDHL